MKQVQVPSVGDKVHLTNGSAGIVREVMKDGCGNIRGIVLQHPDLQTKYYTLSPAIVQNWQIETIH